MRYIVRYHGTRSGIDSNASLLDASHDVGCNP
jgi:hypothetical protein